MLFCLFFPLRDVFQQQYNSYRCCCDNGYNLTFSVIARMGSDFTHYLSMTMQTILLQNDTILGKNPYWFIKILQRKTLRVSEAIF